jgi:hypothetical protein
MSVSQSSYRQIDVYDLGDATNVKGPKYDCTTCKFASSTGVLDADVKPMTLCPWIDFNINKELNRFGLKNGGPRNGPGLLVCNSTISLSRISQNLSYEFHFVMGSL